jgi:hypothetical protein
MKIEKLLLTNLQNTEDTMKAIYFNKQNKYEYIIVDTDTSLISVGIIALLLNNGYRITLNGMEVRFIHKNKEGKN